MSNRWIASALCLIASLMLVAPAGAAVHHEDFSTTTHKDEAATTAHWDTDAGELKLPVFEPEFVGSYPSTDLVSVSVSGDLLVGANETGELDILDITDPASPVLLSSNSFSSEIHDVMMVGDLAYVAADSGGLRIVDLSDPAAPSLVASLLTPGIARGLDVSGNLLLMADGDSGVHLIDVSDSAAPALLGSYDTAGYAYAAKLSGDLAFVADGTAGLVILDVSSPASPALLATYDTPGTALNLDFYGNQVFLADFFNGMQVISVREPTAPIPVSNFATPAAARGVTVNGDLAFLSVSEAGLFIVDYTTLETPQLLFQYDSPGNVFDADIEGEYAYLADDHGGLHVAKVREGVGVQEVGSAIPGERCQAIAIAGNTAYTSSNEGDLLYADISDPGNPAFVGQLVTPGPGYASDLVVYGDLLFMVLYDFGLVIVDITEPRNPAILSQLTGVGGPAYITVAGDLAYLTDYDNGNLHIIDVSDPALPSIVSTTFVALDLTAVELRWPHAYLAGSASGLLVLDVSDPSSPALLDNLVLEYGITDFDLAGDFAYCIGGAFSISLYVIDVSDPANLMLHSETSAYWFEYEIHVMGDLAFVANSLNAISIYDISDPSQPTRMSEHLLGLDVNGGPLAFFGNYLASPRSYEGGELFIAQVFDHGILESQNVAQSLRVVEGAGSITHVRLDSEQTVGFDWEVNPFAPDTLISLAPGDDWLRLDTPADTLLWRSTLSTDGTFNPTASELTLEWLHEYGSTSSLEDVPGDQGGWMRMNFMRSGYDFADETVHPVTGYGSYRRVDDVPLREAVLASPAPDASNHSGLASFDSGRLRQLGESIYLLGEEEGRGEFPPGVWELLSFHPALQQDDYTSLVPTQADSTAEGGIHWSVFLTTTHTTTPSVWFASPPDSGYSVDNIAPGMPGGLLVDHDPYGVTNLSWEESGDADFQYFRVYRGTSEDFEIGAETLAHETAGTSWTDEAGGASFFYKVTALDYAGNESDPATPDQVVSVGESAPAVLALHPNRPNPFNPSTEIRFELPTAGEVRLSVFDVTGRAIRELVSEPLEPGVHAYTWDGRNDGGQPMASGLYFAVLKTHGKTLNSKMVLLK